MSDRRRPLVTSTALTTTIHTRVRHVIVCAILILGVIGDSRTSASGILDDPPRRIEPPGARTPPQQTPETDQSWTPQREAAERGDAAASSTGLFPYAPKWPIYFPVVASTLMTWRLP